MLRVLDLTPIEKTKLEQAQALLESHVCKCAHCAVARGVIKSIQAAEAQRHLNGLKGVKHEANREV